MATAFRTETELAAALQVFLSAAVRGRLRDLWTKDGPTPLALEHLESVETRESLELQELLVLRIAFDLWNGYGGVSFLELVHGLDDTNLRLVLDLLALARPGARS